MARPRKGTELTARQVISFVKEYYQASGKFPTLGALKDNGITRETIRQRFGTKSDLEEQVKQELALSVLSAPEKQLLKKLNKSLKKYVIIGVQNNTELDQDLMACLEQYCTENKARLLALPMYYRSPTSISEEHRLEKEYWWPDLPFGKYVTKNMSLGPYLKLMPEHRVSITASNPLNGLESVSGRYSAIYANPQFQMKVIPEAQDRHPHILHTTGIASLREAFSKTNAGGKAKRFASPGALIVDLRGKRFSLRQLEYKKGVICDLDKVYSPSKVSKMQQYGQSGLVLGDVHAEVVDPEVIRATKRLAKMCNVSEYYLHDLLDFACQSHHNKHNFLMRFMLNKHNKDVVSDAVRQSAEFILDLSKGGGKVHLVDSNHHDHITRWINERDFKDMEADNAYFYVCLMKKLMESVTLDEKSLSLGDDNVLKHAMEVLDPGYVANVVFLDRNKTHKCNGIHVSQHGDVGPNGSRGSIQAFVKTNTPMVIGHSHTPGISKHVWQVGKAAYLHQSYMRGYSSHLNTHCVIYPNGARQLITIIEGVF